MLEIVANCEISSFLCWRFTLTSAYAAIVLSFAFLNLVQTYRVSREIKYSMAPMATCFLQALLTLIESSLYVDNKLIIATNYIQILTFALIA